MKEMGGLVKEVALGSKRKRLVRDVEWRSRWRGEKLRRTAHLVEEERCEGKGWIGEVVLGSKRKRLVRNAEWRSRWRGEKLRRTAHLVEEERCE